MGKLAQRSGLTTGAISMIENGVTKNPSTLTIQRIIAALDVSPDHLYSEAGWYKPHSPTLAPEVVELAEVIEAYPDGVAKEQAKRMVIDVAVILRSIREAMEREQEAASERPPNLRGGDG